MTEERRTVGFTEKTIAALVSKPRTRVFVETREQAEGADGAYNPKNDVIALFPALQDPTAVALEEAGHSLMRQDYLDHEKPTLEILQRLEQIDKRTKIVFDWLEDSRVDTHILHEYPGATAVVRGKWEHRLAEVSKPFKAPVDADPNLVNLWIKLLTALRQITEDFLKDDVPKSYTEVLRRAKEFYDDILTNQPPAQPLPKLGFLIIAVSAQGSGESGGASSGKGSKPPKKAKEKGPKDGQAKDSPKATKADSNEPSGLSESEARPDKEIDSGDASGKEELPGDAKEKALLQKLFEEAQAIDPNGALPVSGTILLIFDDGSGQQGGLGSYTTDVSPYGWPLIRRDVMEVSDE